VRGRDAITRALRRKGIATPGRWPRVTSTDVAHVSTTRTRRRCSAPSARARRRHHGRPARPQRADRGRGEDRAETLEEHPDPARSASAARGDDDVEVEGDAGMLVKLARCCTPVPGDDIVGFVTRGRGVSVHRADCSNVATSSATRTGSSPSTGPGTRPRPSWSDPDRGARPQAPAARHHRGARRPAHQHHLGAGRDPQGPHRAAALHLRARRPVPPRGRAALDPRVSRASTTPTAPPPGSR
jgi:hypothetical protein